MTVRGHGAQIAPMGIDSSFLVALMYITILTLGIANLLTGLATTLTEFPEQRVEKLAFVWALILLLVHFLLFWQTLELMAFDAWTFPRFIVAMAGPVLLFFAAHILLVTGLSASDTDAADQAYLSARVRFFAAFGLLQIWLASADLLVAREVNGAAAFNATLAGISLVLALNSRRRVHMMGTTFACLLLVGSATLQALGRL